ncbi:MAG: cohesin domain-containing protein, partial [Saprospiraceae bacterium]
MNNRQLSFLAALFLLVSSSLLAQRPEAVKYKGSLKTGLRQGCAGSEAGTFTLQGGGLASTRNVKYLCPGDTLTLTHTGLFTFVDPIAATKPGIGYVYFDCKPTKEAKTLGELLTDPCINKTSPINNNGTPLAQKGGLWLAKGSFNDGNIKFYNDGYQQIAFSNGKPRQFWFAPVTVDNFSPNGNQTDFENTNGVPGACIDLNIDSAFSVVYLNALKLSGITGTNNGVGNYTGTFTATGGIPEFDTSANYTVVSMVNDRDPNAIGRLTNGPAKNGMAMNFSVPKPGKYIITISDANGCSMSSFVTIAQDPVDIKVGCADGNIGQEVCIPIRIGKVSDLTAAQFTFSFNPQAMTFSGAKNVNPKLEQTVDQIVITNAIDQGFIKFFWIDFNLMPHDFTNEEVLIEFCFTIKGPPGPTKVNIVPDPGTNYPKLEFSNIDGNSLPVSSLSNLDCTFNINPGSNVDVFYSQCGQTLYGQIFNGVSPYKIYYSSITDPTNIDSIITNQSQPFPIFSNKTGGDYILLTKDTRGPILRDTFKYNAALNNLSLNLSNLLPESCKGGDGKVTVGITGGTPVYRQTWSTGSISPTIQGLKSGKYFVTVTDAQGCMATDSVVLTSEKPKSAILIDRMPLCSGVSDGRTSPDFGTILGIRPYTFKWIGTGTMIGNAFTNLAEGRVGLVVIDAKGCS